MAIPFSVAALHSIIARRAPQAVENGLAEKSFLYSRLAKLPASDASGPKWQETTTANTSVGRFTVGADLATPGAALFTEASLGFGNYAGSLRFADRQLKQIAEAGNEMMIANLIQQQLDHLVRQLVDAVEADILTGTSTDGIIGLSSAIDTANTYAGIDRSSVTNFACAEKDGSGAALTAAMIDEAYGTQVFTNLGRVSALYTSHSQAEKMRAFSTGAVSTYVTQTAQEAANMGSVKHVSYTDIFYRGLPVFEVPAMGDVVYLVDEDALAIERLGDFEVMEPQWDGLNVTWIVRGYMQMRLHRPKKAGSSVTNISA